MKALHDNDIPVVTGTDMGLPGTSLARELVLWGSLTPMQALQTATIDAVHAMQAE